VMACLTSHSAAQTALTWPEVRAKFETGNPTLLAGQVGINESRAAEITAYLRPNPQLSMTADQIGRNDTGRPFDDLLPLASVSYLHEREHKRELRRDSAQGATAVAIANQADLQRNLTFTLRGVFVQVLQAKAFRTLAIANLASFDQVLTISRDRLREGDIAQIDLDRLQLQRVQYEADVQTADVNLRTAKIQLLMLLNDQTSVERFDVDGLYDFAPPGQTLDAVRQAALDTRPDLRAAVQAIDKARAGHRPAGGDGASA